MDEELNGKNLVKGLEVVVVVVQPDLQNELAEGVVEFSLKFNKLIPSLMVPKS